MAVNRGSTRETLQIVTYVAKWKYDELLKRVSLTKNWWLSRGISLLCRQVLRLLQGRSLNFPTHSGQVSFCLTKEWKSRSVSVTKQRISLFRKKKRTMRQSPCMILLCVHLGHVSAKHLIEESQKNRKQSILHQWQPRRQILRCAEVL